VVRAVERVAGENAAGPQSSAFMPPRLVAVLVVVDLVGARLRAKSPLVEID
jgi:hypothetical protein